MRVYHESRDLWIGYYRGDTHHYICPLPTLVIRWARREPESAADSNAAVPLREPATPSDAEETP